MTDELDKIEEEIKIMEAKIRLQKQQNELFLLKDGTFEHFIYGAFKFFDNPLLFIVCIIMFAIGVFLGGLK